MTEPDPRLAELRGRLLARRSLASRPGRPLLRLAPAMAWALATTVTLALLVVLAIGRDAFESGVVLEEEGPVAHRTLKARTRPLSW